MPLVDLDDPEELRARWTALAAVAHATGFDRRWYADEDGYHHQDETGSVLRMVRLEDGRAVLFGFQTQHSQTRRADLLAGSPDWIGQPEVRRRQTAGELGFVYGAFNGTWARAAYPGDPWQPAEDGFTQIGQWITSDSDAAAEMIEWVAEWADYLGGLDELQPFGVQLIQTAGSSGISLEALQEFFDHFEIDARSPVQPDLPSGVVAAEDFTRNFAVAESLADALDTAEVSVVEDVVIGASDGPLPVDEEDEQSFIVPPGISPFTGQPIDEAPQVPSYEQPVYDDQPGYEEPAYEGPAVYQQVAYRPEAPAEYGVTNKKQGWLRRRKHDNVPEPEQPTGYEGGGASGGRLLGRICRTMCRVEGCRCTAVGCLRRSRRVSVVGCTRGRTSTRVCSRKVPLLRRTSRTRLSRTGRPPSRPAGASREPPASTTRSPTSRPHPSLNPNANGSAAPGSTGCGSRIPPAITPSRSPPPMTTKPRPQK